MRTRWFDRPLDTVVFVWRLERSDGVALGFVGHDRDLVINHLQFHAAPGLTPSAIEMDDGLEATDMEIAGVLEHQLIAAADLAAGRWDGARIMVGLADWSLPDTGVDWLSVGELGTITQSDGRFSAELVGLKARLEASFAPVATPACRALFCGPGCGLSRAAFEHEAQVLAIRPNAARFAIADATQPASLLHGEAQWLTGANAGLISQVLAVEGEWLIFAAPLASAVSIGDRALLIEGCDHEFETCAARFGNAANFQGEPHLPGNDLLTRTGQS